MIATHEYLLLIHDNKKENILESKVSTSLLKRTDISVNIFLEFQNSFDYCLAVVKGSYLSIKQHQASLLFYTGELGDSH